MKKSTDTEIVIVKERGVNSKGFGHIAKRIMIDPDLTLTAKGIYCYLSSMAGSSETSFTRRSTILRDLVIGEHTYDNHINKLQERGYITRAQARRPDGSFGTTTIEFIMIPSHLKTDIMDAQKNEVAPTMYSGTVYALGWGSIPRVVMQDRDISAKAKGLYGYICAYAGATGEAFPSRTRILSELNIYRHGYDAYKKELENKKYISFVQSRYVDGIFGRSFFRINMFPDQVDTTASKICVIHTNKQEKPEGISEIPSSDHQKLKNPDAVDPCPKNEGAVNPCPKNEGAVDPCPKNEGTVDPCPKTQGTVDPCPENEGTVDPCPKNQGTVDPCPKNEGTVDPCPKNEGTVEPWVENKRTVEPWVENERTVEPWVENERTVEPWVENKRTVEPWVENPWAEKPWAEKPWAENERTATYIITNNSFTNNSFTNNILYDRLIDQIREKISYRLLLFAYDGNTVAIQGIDSLVNQLVLVLSTNATRVMINGTPHITEEVRKTLMTVSNPAVVNIIERYLVYHDEVRDIGTYLLSSIYNELNNPTKEELIEL